MTLDAGPRAQIGRAKPGDQAGAVATRRVELGDQRRGRALAVVPRASDFALIPGLRGWLVAGQDETDPAGEAAALALDEVAEDFFGAPLAGRRVPCQDVVWMGRDLGANRRGRALDQPGHLTRRERPNVVAHRRVSSRAMTMRWIWFVPS